MFSWLEGLVSSIASSIGGVFEGIGDTIVNAIWDNLVKWLFNAFYDSIADVFTQMGDMGAEIFDLSWVQATVELFTLFGWALFAAGIVVAVFDLAIEYQNGRANVRSTALDWIKGFMAVSLFTITPIELYKFCVSLQNTLSGDLTRIFASQQGTSLGEVAMFAMQSYFNPNGTMIPIGLFELVMLIALGFCVFKIFFDNIKRGGILLIQIAVGSLHMFSIPRGYDEGFNQWVKQVIALCLTAFLQTTLLFLGLLTFPNNILLAIGIMMAAAEVPRIAQQFGLDTSVRVNVMSAVHMGTSAVNLVRAVGK